ncbi:MAG: ABC transporter substrate-binding protein [Spirochaetota bacterium]
MRSRVSIVVVALLLVLGTGIAFAAGQGEGTGDGEPVAVDILMPGGPQPPDSDTVFEAARDYAGPIIGAYPVIEFVPWDNWPNRKRLLLQAGEEMDIVFTASWSDFAQEVARNAWLPLNDLIDEEAPQIRDVVGVFLDGATVDGNIYAVPTVKEQAEGTQFIFNAALVEEYNVPVDEIDSFEDLEPWLAIIAENEPDVIPYLLDGLSTPTETFRYHWDAVGAGREFYLEHPEMYGDEEEVVSNAYFIDEVWETAQITRDFYRAGYFQPEVEDVGSNLEAQSTKYQTAGNYFVWSHVSHPGKVPEQSVAWGHELVGSGPVWPQMVTKNILNGSMMAISQTSDHAVEAIKLLELMNVDQDFNNLLNFGIEGRHYEFVDESAGVIRPVAAANTGEGYAPNMQWALQNQFLTYLTENDNPNKWELYQQYNDEAGIWPTVGFIPDLSPVQTQVASVTAVTEEYEQTLIRGLVDPASIMEDFQEALISAGVEDVEAELQRQVREFLDNN